MFNFDLFDSLCHHSIETPPASNSCDLIFRLAARANLPTSGTNRRPNQRLTLQPFNKLGFEGPGRREELTLRSGKPWFTAGRFIESSLSPKSFAISVSCNHLATIYLYNPSFSTIFNR